MSGPTPLASAFTNSSANVFGFFSTYISENVLSFETGDCETTSRNTCCGIVPHITICTRVTELPPLNKAKVITPITIKAPNTAVRMS